VGVHPTARPILHDDPVGIDTGPVLLLGTRSGIGLALAERATGPGRRTFVPVTRGVVDLDPEWQALPDTGAPTVHLVEFGAGCRGEGLPFDPS
jgi:hypothetical protein